MHRHSISVAALALAMSAVLFARQDEGATAPGSPGIVELSAESLAGTALSPLESAPYMKVVEHAGARAANVSSFRSADQRFDAGVSQYETVTLQLQDWPIDEFMYILSGRVEITDARGYSRVYGPGDGFVMPKGFHGIWKQLSPIKKINVSYSSDREN